MAIPEARLATAADAAGILVAQNQTAAVLSAASIAPWTAVQVAGILDNASHPRGQFVLFVVDPIVSEVGLAGFMLAKRYRNQPPEPDPTVLHVQLIACRLAGHPVGDRARLRYVTLSTFKAMHRYCYTNSLTWKARTLTGDGRFAIEGVITDMLPVGITVMDEIRNGVAWRVIRSNDPVINPTSVPWPVN
jgi:hypothetical protein